MNLRERVYTDEFKNKVPYPHRTSDHSLWILQKKIYNEGAETVKAKFRAALEKEYHTTGSPKADLLWEMAWDAGHSCGLSEVLSYYEKFAALVMNFEEVAKLLEKVVPQKSLSDAPCQLSNEESSAWADGYASGVSSVLNVLRGQWT